MTEPMVHGTQTYYIQVAISKRLAAFARTLSTHIRVGSMLRFPLASVVLVIVAVYFTLRKVLKPLREASGAAARIDAHNLSKRLPTRNLPNEFLPLVEAFNLTLDRLEKGYIVQRAFLAGAAADELPKLFRRFWRGPMRRNDGAGLGLSICAEIAAAHKWELAARSTGRGAEFMLSFRANTVRNVTERAALATAGSVAEHW
jgi:signal transduction histidine kinase